MKIKKNLNNNRKKIINLLLLVFNPKNDENLNVKNDNKNLP